MLGLPTGAPTRDGGYAWQHGLYWLACALARDAPLALLVDDLQWADAPSARALAFIARRLEGQPIALVLGTRPAAPDTDVATLAADPVAERRRPAPLTEGAVAALVAARLPDVPDDAFVGACPDVTGGNPFLVSELLAEVSARGSVPADVRATVPRSVADTVLLRLARLPPRRARWRAR